MQREPEIKNHTRASLTTLQMLSSKRNKIIIPRNIEDDIEEDGFIRMCVFVTVSLHFKLPWTEIPVVLKSIVAFLMKRQRIYLGNINLEMERMHEHIQTNRLKYKYYTGIWQKIVCFTFHVYLIHKISIFLPHQWFDTSFSTILHNDYKTLSSYWVSTYISLIPK